MKRIVSIVLICISVFANAQDANPDKYSWGINLDQKITAYYTNFGLPMSLFATLSKAKHQFEFGPQYYLAHYKPGYKLGFCLQYKFYPNGNTNKFNTYLIPSLLFRYGKEERGAWGVDYENQTEHYGNKDITMLSGLLGAGYGLELQLSTKLYLASDFRILAGYENLKSKEVYPTNPSLNQTVSANYLHLNWQFGLNVGFRF